MKKNFEIEEVVYSKYRVDAEDGRILYADDNFCNKDLCGKIQICKRTAVSETI